MVEFSNEPSPSPKNDCSKIRITGNKMKVSFILKIKKAGIRYF